MNEMDDAILVAMRVRGEGDVQVEKLLADARRTGVRRQRAHRALFGAGVTATAALVVVAVAVAPWSGAAAPPPGGQPGATTSPPLESALSGLRPPAARDAPPLTRGGRPGGDHLLHVDVTDPHAYGLSWRSGNGWESLTALQATDLSRPFNEYEVLVGGSPAALAEADASTGERLPAQSSEERVYIDGRKATLAWGGGPQRFATLTWQPVEDAWARILVVFGDIPKSDRAAQRTSVLRIAGWVRFDRVYRCPVPFRLSWAPPGARTVACAFAVTDRQGKVTLKGSAEIRVPSGASFTVGVDRAEDVAPIVPNTEVAGRRVESRAGWVRYDYRSGVVELEPGAERIAQRDAERVIGGFTPVPTPDFRTWPDDPLR